MRKLTAIFRKRLATLFVAFYALGVLAPHAAMAFSHGSMAAHCLTEPNAAPHDHKVLTHVHDDGVVHQHGKAQSKQAGESNDETQAVCCGLFFMTALAADTDPVTLRATPAGKVAAAAQDFRADHPPGRLHRPPIV